MGFYYTPWVSDMLDLSSGVGSWNLSMNQGLAHLQATSLMNSVWSFNGCFSPYTSMGNGLDYLLDPGFAVWQTMNGISSTGNMFGNFGNFGSFLNPWQTTTPTNPSNDSNLSSTELLAKNQFGGLKDLLTAFANSLKSSTNATDKSYGEWLLNKLTELNNKKDTSWADKLTELQKIYDNEILSDSNKAKFTDFIQNKNTHEYKVGDLGKYNLNDLLYLIGFKKDESGVLKGAKDRAQVDETTINEIHTAINALSNAQSNISAVESLTSDKVMRGISMYNRTYGKSIADEFANNYSEAGDKDTATSSFEILVNALIARSKSVEGELDATAKEALDKTRQDLTSCIKTDADGKKSITDTNLLKTSFNKLYALIRMAEVKVVERELDHDYQNMSAKGTSISSLLDLTNKTIADLASELSMTEDAVKELVKTVNCTPHSDMTIPVEETETPESGNGSSPVTNTQQAKEKEFEENADYEGCFQKTGTVVDGKNVYQWTDTAPCYACTEITTGSFFIISNGVPRPLDEEGMTHYYAQKSPKTTITVGGNKVSTWAGEDFNCDGIMIRKGEPCIIENNKPRALTDAENTEYGLKTKVNAGKSNDKQIYKWTHSKESNGVKQGDLFVMEGGKPVALSGCDKTDYYNSNADGCDTDYCLSNSTKLSDITLTVGGNTVTVPLYKWTNTECTCTIGTLTVPADTQVFTVENGQVRLLTNTEMNAIPADVLDLI